MFRARHFQPPIEEDDIEIAKKKLKEILKFASYEDTFDDVSSDTDDETFKADNEQYFVLEKVLEERVKKGKLEFNIKWEGFEESTWEPYENFVTQGSKMGIYLFYTKKWEKKHARSVRERQLNAKSNSSTRDKKDKKPSDRTAAAESLNLVTKKEDTESESSRVIRTLKAVPAKESKEIRAGLTAGLTETAEQKPKDKLLNVRRDSQQFRPNPNLSRSSVQEMDRPCSSKTNVKKFKSSTSTSYYRSLDNLRRKLEAQRKSEREIAEQQKKEKAEKKRREQKEQEEMEKRRKEVLEDLASSSGDEEILQAYYRRCL